MPRAKMFLRVLAVTLILAMTLPFLAVAVPLPTNDLQASYWVPPALDGPAGALKNGGGKDGIQPVPADQTEVETHTTPPRPNVPIPNEQPKISGYLFSAETGEPLSSANVQLCPLEGCSQGTTTTTDGKGYYQFTFDSILEVVTDTEQITGHFTPGEIHVAPDGGDYHTIFSVYYSGDDYHIHKNKHQLAYIYPNRDSWGWENEQQGLHQFFVLHPPRDLPLATAIDPTKAPLLFVHGHGGKDSTWMGLRPSLEDRGYQTWEVYYPSRDPIVEGAAALKDAVNVILRHYNVNQVDMLTYSMGGPVSRAYVSGTARYPWNSGNTPLLDYTHKVRKLLQLAPTSFGVLNLVRLGDPFWRNYCSALLAVLEALGFQDPHEPALQDLTLASPFFEELYHHPVPLAPQDFLIVAGTKAFLRLCQEAKSQTDLVIGNSSASLVNQGVPLGLVYRDHSEMVGQINIPYRLVRGPGPQPPHDGDDDPYNDAFQLVEMIHGFLSGDILRVEQNLDVYIDPGDTPEAPQTWEVTVVDRTSKPPRLETRTNWPANQWNDRHYDTDFDAGGFWLRIANHNIGPRDQVRICDPVHNRCWQLRQASTTALWFLDDTEWGYVLPASEFGYPYTVIVHDGGRDIELGQFTIKPLQTTFVTLSRIYFPVVFRAAAPGSGQVHSSSATSEQHIEVRAE